MKKIFILLLFANFLCISMSNAQCVNFTQYTPSGWDNSIVISAVTGTNTSESEFYYNQTLVLDIAIINNGNCNATKTVQANVFLDAVFKTTITFPILNSFYQGSTIDYIISGSLGVGSHTIQVDIDNPSLIPETNESDNTFYRTFNVVSGACVSSSVNTIFNGNRNFNTEHYQDTHFRLKDQCQTSTIRVRDYNSSTTLTNPLEINPGNNSWTSNTERFGASVMWAAKNSNNYYSTVHSRNSFDGAYGSIEGYVNSSFWNGTSYYTDNATMGTTPAGAVMNVGLGSAGTLANSWGAIDIIGHEYTHAITASTAKFVYQNESGALDESFSDIFGEAIENYTLGSNDWLLGANRSSGAIRNMANPSASPYNQPDTYLGTNWNSGPNTVANDNGGVHTNSGVQNYWFYLLSQGGSGVNDNGSVFYVTGIGIAKAREIAFKTLTENLLNQPNANYAMARTASILSAEQIYGVNSVEASTVKNAWCAVGVGNTVPSTVTVSGGGTFCNSTIITASGGSGGNIYFQGTNSNGTSTAIRSSSQTLFISGTYYFRSYNACGWGPTASVSVTINTVPSAVTVSGGGYVCNSTNIQASGGNGGTIYFQGTNSNGTSTLTPSSSQAVYSSGTYYFRAYNGCGWSNQGSVTVTIGTIPAGVSIPGGGNFCNAVILQATGGSGGNIYFQGTNSNGTSTAILSSTQTVTTSGTYYFRANNTCGWGQQGSITVYVNYDPSGVSVSGGGTVCNSTIISASGGSDGTMYFQGTNSNGTSTTTPSSSQTITSSGTYYFRAKNNCGWGPSGSAAVTINTIPSAVSASGGGTFCNTTTISATGGTGGTIYYQGTTSGGTSTTTPSISQSAINASGKYYFRSNNSCGWSTEGGIFVTINAPSTVLVTGSGTFCNTANLQVFTYGTGTIYWQGSGSGGTSTSTPITSSINVGTSGTHYFRVLNSCGWGPESGAIVTINNPPSAVSVSGGGSFCTNTNLVASGGSGGTIYWQGTTSGGTSPSTPSTNQPVNSSGTYYFRSNNSCGWGQEGTAIVGIALNSLNLNGNASNGIQKAKLDIVSNQAISPGMNVIYEAGKSIELTGVFSAVKGSIFKAEIKTCN